MKGKAILNILQQRGSAFCREIATATGMGCAEAIYTLIELERLGKVVQRNGYWSLSIEPPAEPVKTKRVNKRKSAKENPSADGV